ncbi:MAG: hypothetical protein HY699_08240 [Deltaproteobacteria bacterium]|nr:hypothetical protein [Deltaproteobacteria bacterium]
MKKQYDFSKGVRGKFYRRGARLRLPVYLQPKLEAFLSRLAEQQRTDVATIVNDWIRRDIELIKSVGR